MRPIAALLTLTFALAACSTAERVAGTTLLGAEDADEMSQASPEEPVEIVDAGEPGRLDVGFAAIDDRKVIRRASLRLHATDTRAAFEEIVRLTESVGGFIAGANVFPFEGDEDGQPDVSMTLRIPADRLTSTMKAIKDTVDEVVSESQSAEDVTDRFVDLEARLRNLEALEIELRALLAEVRAQPNADPQKLLTVFNELSSVRGQIEQIQGQLNVLGDLTALATLEVHISQTPQTAPIVEQPWEPAAAAREALTSLVTALQGLADLAINFALFVLPMLLLAVGIPAAIGYGVYRRFIRRRPESKTEPAPAES